MLRMFFKTRKQQLPNEEPEIKEEAPQTESSTILRRRLSQNKDMV